MHVNVNKSLCIRFGKRYNADYVCTLSSKDEPLKWVNRCRYLGVYFVSGHSLKCSKFDQSKRRYFKEFNSIFSKVGRLASEEVVKCLLRAKLLPVLFSERDLTFTFTICRRPSVCLSSVTFVHPTQAIEIFSNVSTPFNTLVI